MLKFLDTTEIVKFATDLADDLGRRFPPASEGRTDPGAKHQIDVILNGLSARAMRFHQERKLGIYKKAKLGNTFRWRLKELGYSDTFSDSMTRQLVGRLATKPTVASKA